MEGLLKIFIAGITLGNGPCLFTCMPVILPYIGAMPGLGDGVSGWKAGLKLTLIFSVSRVAAYSFLGFASVVLYRFVFDTVGRYGVYLRPILGIIIFGIGAFYFLSVVRKKIPASPVCAEMKRRAGGGSRLNMALFGILVGFSPCPPLLAVLTYIAATANDPVWGLSAGFLFGLGTVITPLIPLGTMAGFAAGKMERAPKLFAFARVVSAFILAYFGLRLMGIL